MFLVAKTPTLLNSNLPEAEATKKPESGAARCRTGGKPQISAPYSDGRPWCQTPEVQGVVGVRLVFDRIYRINRIEGRGQERGRRGNHAESAEEL